MKLIIFILPIGITLIAMLYSYSRFNKGAEMDSFMKKIWIIIAGCTVIFTIMFVSLITYSMFFEKENEEYAKYSRNHIRLQTEQDEQMDKVIKLLEEIKRNTDFIGRTKKIIISSRPLVKNFA